MELQAQLDAISTRVRAVILGPVADILDLLAATHTEIRTHTGKLDNLARTAHHFSGDHQPNPLAVRAIVQALRGPLAIIANPQDHTAGEFVAASAAIRSVIAQVPADKLDSESVRIQIGRRRHNLLRTLLATEVTH
jgi:type IV secretory pathway VirB2 component (pilin)